MKIIPRPKGPHTSFLTTDAAEALPDGQAQPAALATVLPLDYAPSLSLHLQQEKRT